MKRISRILFAFLALLLAFTLTACGDLNTTLQTVQDVADLAQDVTQLLASNAPEGTAAPEADIRFENPSASPPIASQTPEPTLEPTAEPTTAPTPEPTPETPVLSEDGVYTSSEDVALYLHLYGKLPGNFITKKEAQALGWTGGSLEPYAPGKCIGGDRFGNYEGILPKGNYTECDIDTLGAKSRGAKRLVFNKDGDIYYTDDHYQSFTQLYGQEEP